MLKLVMIEIQSVLHDPEKEAYTSTVYASCVAIPGHVYVHTGMHNTHYSHSYSRSK